MLTCVDRILKRETDANIIARKCHTQAKAAAVSQGRGGVIEHARSTLQLSDLWDSGELLEVGIHMAHWGDMQANLSTRLEHNSTATRPV